VFQVLPQVKVHGGGPQGAGVLGETALLLSIEGLLSAAEESTQN